VNIASDTLLGTLYFLNGRKSNFYTPDKNF